MRGRLVGLVLFLGLLLTARLAGARPGGGQSYHSSSHSSSSHSYSSPAHSYSSPSHSYSSGSHGTTVYVPPASDSGMSPARSPSSWLLPLLVIAIIVLVIYAQRRRGPARAQVQGDAREQGSGVAALTARDPSFDARAFAEFAGRTVARVNDAWCAGSMGPARRLVSDGVYVRFQTQLRLARAAGKRNVMADWKLLESAILAAESDARWDTVHVKIAAEARDTDVAAATPAAQANAAAHKAPLRRYEEVWSFLRRRGVKSQGGAPALDGQCPNCGAPLPLGETVRCDACKALVNSGEHGWVLAEITQPEEWRPYGAQAEALPGLAELQQLDPTVSRQALEDRASVLFWRWAEAVATGSRKGLERFCLVAGSPPAPPEPLTDVVVGAAETVAVARGGDGFDRAVVAIAWSAGVGGGEPVGRQLQLTMARTSGATSKRTLSALDCPNCGGPLADSDLIKCNYCDEPLSGGKHEWALESVG